MQYSFIKDLVEGVWMIHPNAASVWLPLLQGALSGLNFEREAESFPPYMVSSKNGAIIQSGTGNQSEASLVYVTSLRGVTLKHDAPCGPVGTRTIAQRLLEADKQKNILGHILVTESGGGQAGAVAELSDAISKLTKPIVAWVDGMSASAAYYINSYCGHIMVSRGTDQIGCIGTMISFEGFPKFSKSLDGKVTARIYADDATEKNDEYESALEGNFKLMKERVLNPHNDKFVSDIKNNRKGVLPELLKGRTYYASDVLGTLIDSIGSFEDAINKVKEMAADNSVLEVIIKPNNIKKMPELINLNAIESLKDFVVTEGQTSFNEAQLSDIEEALATGAAATAQVTDLTNQNTSLTTDKISLNDELQQKVSRISELETALEAANNGAADSTASISKNTDGKNTAEVKDEFASAKEFCLTHLKNHS